MKRTGEVILGIIGALSFAVVAAIGGGLVWLVGNDEFYDEFIAEMQAQDPELYGDLGGMTEAMSSGGWSMVVVSVIAIILGIVAMILLRGNKMPKVAGIIFIVVAVVGTVATVFLGFFGGLFYLIAGIMCLVRKPKPVIE